MPKSKVSLDVTQIENFIFDMSRCIKCKGCTWVDHIYMPGMKYSTRCPSPTKYLFDSYGAYGKMRIGVALVEGKHIEAKEHFDHCISLFQSDEVSIAWAQPYLALAHHHLGNRDQAKKLLIEAISTSIRIQGYTPMVNSTSWR